MFGRREYAKIAVNRKQRRPRKTITLEQFGGGHSTRTALNNSKKKNTHRINSAYDITRLVKWFYDE